MFVFVFTGNIRILPTEHMDFTRTNKDLSANIAWFCLDFTSKPLWTSPMKMIFEPYIPSGKLTVCY